jgi:ribonuclease HII
MADHQSVPDRLVFEREWWARGIVHLAGIDEAGRGPLAGPVVVAAVIFPATWAGIGIPDEYRDLNDSKQLTQSTRDRFFDQIIGDSRISHAIAEIGHEVIDRINILAATHRGMNEVLKRLCPAAEHALVDGTRVPSLACPHTALIKGDARSYSIAAASVLAKVTRDRCMIDADRLFPLYGFARHKGYPTPDHLEAVKLHGPCPIHRRSFSPLRQPDPELFPR